ncbi:MAG: ubiquinol-cytochrome C chaperone family protein [Ferrovibrio sp.]
MALYRRIVEQARQPDFYSRHGVPDSLDGRFDMIVLHSFLVMRRLRAIGSKAADDLSQDLFDLLFADMDVNLREIGVGDLGVGKRVKKMAQAFYGRVEAYEEGLTATDDGILSDALGRNLYGTTQPALTALIAMAAYMRAADSHLSAQSTAGIMAGNVDFPPSPA